MTQGLALTVLMVYLVSWANAQQNTSLEPGWTDKNNTERTAAYMIQVTYNEHGYWSAKVKIEKMGPKRVFEVDPGPLYHVKEVKISGLKGQSLENINIGAPKAGEVYSPARVNDWISTLRKKYPQRVHWGTHFDQKNAGVFIDVNFQEAP